MDTLTAPASVKAQASENVQHLPMSGRRPYLGQMLAAGYEPHHQRFATPAGYRRPMVNDGAVQLGYRAVGNKRACRRRAAFS